MRARILIGISLSAALLCTSALADPPVKRKSQRKDDEVPVFVTGSLIPKRIKLHPIGTKTVSPVRIIGRTEIDQNGRQTTSGLLLDDPSVSVIHR